MVNAVQGWTDEGIVNDLVKDLKDTIMKFKVEFQKIDAQVADMRRRVEKMRSKKTTPEGG